jgi:hypothetical protein
MEEENSVAVSGPDTAVPDTDTEFRVSVESTTKGSPKPSVRVDGEEVDIQDTESGYLFSHKFEEEGYHRIQASIPSDDVYQDNNRFYKTVKVIERPEVLVIGEKGELSSAASRFFDLTYRDSLPEDLSDFYSVILKEKISSQRLESYVSSGNGLVYTGEGAIDILPVREAEIESETQNPKILVGIDSSEGALEGSRGWGSCQVGKSIKESKILAQSIVTSLSEKRPSSILGVFAYNNSVYSFGEPRALSNTRYSNKLLGSRGIGAIPVCGTAYQVNAIRKASDIMGSSPGNIILVTDGTVPPDGGIYAPGDEERVSSAITDPLYRQNALQEARKLGSDIELSVVAVGDHSGNNGFLEDLADAGGGEFYSSKEQFFRLEKNLQGGGGSDLKGITVGENDHFITRSLSGLGLSVTELDQVKEKPSAEVLLETSSNRPFLTTWRYGLGRVASFSGGSRDLKRVVSRAPDVASRTLSWSVGDPQRKQERYISVESGRYGEKVSLVASYAADGFVRSGPDTYRASTRPESLGFHRFLGASFGYNYRKEVQELGYDTAAMRRISSMTGGEILKPRELSDLREQARTKVSTAATYTSVTPWILVVTMVVFLVQAGYRKRKGWL